MSRPLMYIMVTCLLLTQLTGKAVLADVGRILYLSQEPGEPELRLTHISFQGQSQMPILGEIFDPFSESQTSREMHQSYAWSPNGQYFMEYSGKYLSSYEGGWLSVHRPSSQLKPVSVKEVYAPVWSPDATGIAVLTLQTKPDKPWRRLELFDPVSGQLSAITSSEPQLSAPAWPAVDTLSFYTRSGGKPELVRLRLKDRLRQSQPWPFDPPVEMSWSPDQGLLAAITQRHPEAPYQLVVFAPGSAKSWQRSGMHAALRPRWSPDGRWLAFLSDAEGRYEVYVLPSDLQSPPRRLTKGARRRASDLVEFVWSPDSSSLAYVSDRDGDREIWRVGLRDGREQQLSQNEVEDFYPVWLPE